MPVNKPLFSKKLESMAEETVIRHAEEENAEFGHALKNISEKQLKEILNGGESRREQPSAASPASASGGERRKRRLAWRWVATGISVAAVLFVLVWIPLQTIHMAPPEQKLAKADMQVDNLLWQLYGSPETGAARGGEGPVYIEAPTAEEWVKANLNILQQEYSLSETPQEIYINGKTLALAYIKLHERRKAKIVLEEVIMRLQTDEDYADAVEQCRKILQEIE